jgi:hypothetical protein
VGEGCHLKALAGRRDVAAKRGWTEGASTRRRRGQRRKKGKTGERCEGYTTLGETQVPTHLWPLWKEVPSLLLILRGRESSWQTALYLRPLGAAVSEMSLRSAAASQSRIQSRFAVVLSGEPL